MSVNHLQPTSYQHLPAPHASLGHRPQPAPPAPSGGPSSGGSSLLAALALVCGVLAPFTALWIAGIPVAMAAVALGIAGRSGPNRTMATWGLGLGLFGLVVALGNFLPEQELDVAPAVADLESAASAEATPAPAERTGDEDEPLDTFGSSVAALAVGECFVSQTETEVSTTEGERVRRIDEVDCDGAVGGDPEGAVDGIVSGAFGVPAGTTEDEVIAMAEDRCPGLTEDFLAARPDLAPGSVGYLYQTGGLRPLAVRCFLGTAPS